MRGHSYPRFTLDIAFGLVDVSVIRSIHDFQVDLLIQPFLYICGYDDECVTVWRGYQFRAHRIIRLPCPEDC